MNFQQQWFRPVSQEVTLMLNGEFGIGHGYGGKPLPFFKNFYAGGPGSVRGFEPMSLGPRDINNNALGGTSRVVGNAELLFPMPGLSKEKSVRLSVFADAGAVYGTSNLSGAGSILSGSPVTAASGTGALPGSSGLRYSVGAALTWISPVGPLKISFGKALNAKPDDKLQKFQFTLGSVF